VTENDFPMQATRFEYKFRFLIYLLICVLGFGLVPVADRFTPGIVEQLQVATRSTWLIGASILSRQHLLTFSTATVVLLIVALVFTGLGAWFRVWGAAYAGARSVTSSEMHGERMLADGPYRRTRNPLFLGTLLHTIGLAILMPPVGAALAIALIWIFQVRLALAEETFLGAKLGEPYAAYKKAVPRFLPAPSPQVAAGEAQPHWGLALLRELYFVGVFVTMAVFGWNFNADPMYRGILISLGAGIVARAFLPQVKSEA
jgi:protein-S-isoprenylcysteine O-methyltransferase Ste14